MSETIHTPIGPIPCGWDYREIGPHIEMVTGPAFDSSRFSDDSAGTRLARGINITKGHFRWKPEITQYWPEVTPDIKKYLLRPDDVIIGMDGSLVGRNYALVTSNDIPSLLVQRVARLRTDEALDCQFLYYFIASDFWLSYVDVVKTHSGIPHISNGNIREFRISFPAAPEQRKIASILATVDRLIEQTEALIEKYRRVKQGMMADLLSRGVDEHGKLRPTQRQAPELYKQSELGWIPKEWDVEVLGDIAIFDSGYAFKEHELTPAGTKVVRITNLHRKDFPYWRYEGPVKPTWVVESGDLLFSWAGVASSIDAYFYSGEAALLNQHIYNFRIADVKVKRFVYYYLKFILPTLRSNIEGGAGQLHLTKDKIQSIAIPRPNESEHDRLLQMMESLNARVDNEYLQLTKLRTLKTGLMQDLLTGKVRVKVDEYEEAMQPTPSSAEGVGV